MLEGKNVNLKRIEREDLPLLQDWLGNREFMGEFLPFMQWSRAELEKAMEAGAFEEKWYFIHKKDGTKIGYIFNFNMLHVLGKY